jgi:hypothetical protein
VTSVKGLDRYARSAPEWCVWGYYNYSASRALFESGDSSLWFPAAILGHHALEMFLKAVLIHEGMTAFDPGKIKQLDPTLGLTKGDCVWGHALVVLAKKVAGKRSDFDLDAQLRCDVAGEKGPINLRRGFEIFDPFFSELRYPVELQSVGGLGVCHGALLGHLFAHLEPLLSEVPPPSI